MQNDDWLVPSTVHSAKGLDWQAVHLVAAYDGNFRSDRAAGSRESPADERRLLYAAVTRARRSLTVFVPRRYYHHKDRGDSHGYGNASRLLSAAARACCDVVHPTTTPAGRLQPQPGADRSRSASTTSYLNASTRLVRNRNGGSLRSAQQ